MVTIRLSLLTEHERVCVPIYGRKETQNCTRNSFSNSSAAVFRMDER